MPTTYFYGDSEQEVNKQMQDFLYTYNVTIVDQRIRKRADKYEGSIEFNDPFGEFRQ